ncbi:uncharacterized protein LOC114350154 isoform X2 [Ostrinia furnacalis]|uniref:uncharacterized protein LOC114350154 isoform X2 n=1 Tax=Ostrinia furnacalis TaxID=93504 RepID=UPI0010394E64|nr:uncharacterized protein LOC114350154 isoform X2 [Ostrinia furnacalis]
MPQKTCCVPGCSVMTYDGVTLHNFPDPEKNSKKFNVWVANIYGDLATLDATTNFIKRRVCHNHFEDVHKYPKNRLSQLAMPVLHLPAKIKHNFPNPERDADRFKAWVRVAGGKLDSEEDYKLYRKKIVCDIHFTDKDRTRSHRLNCLAVPSLHLDLGKHLHMFPNPKRFHDQFKAWVKVVEGKLNSTDDYSYFRTKRICDRHFTENDRNRNNRINAIAIPSLFINERARTETDSEFSERARTETDSESSEDENLIMKCCVPGCKDLTDSSSARHLHSFPNPITDRERYRKWMLAIYGENADDTDEHKVRRICTSHFEAKYHCRFGRLSNNAIPTLNLSESDNELKCSDVEYLDEDLEDDFDLADPLKESLDKEQPTIAAKLEQDFKTALDEIDLLFLSYAKTFRTLSKQFQTMLKLDMAKLFTRYEIKNDMLSKSKEENQDTVPVELTLPVEETSKPSTLLPKDPKKVFLRQVPLKTVMSSLTNIRTYSKSNPKIRILNETKLQSKDITEKSSVVEVVPTKLKPIYKKPKLKPTSPDPISTHESIITIDVNNEDETTINEMHTQNEDDPELMMEVTDPIKTETVFVFSDDMVKIVDKT